MKKIEAIIRKSKFKEVKRALLKSKVENFTYWLVRNVGEATESRVYRGIEYETSAVERIYLSLLVEGNVNNIVQVIVNAGLTGEEGDGRIFVTEISEAYRLITKNDKEHAIKL